MSFWFGDINSEAENSNLFDKLSHILSQPWYYANETANGAEGILRSCENQVNGLFLLRLNIGTHISTEVSPFTISTVEITQPGSEKSIRHLRIYVDKEANRYVFKDKIFGQNSCENKYGFVGLITHLMEHQPDICSMACPKREILY